MFLLQYTGKWAGPTILTASHGAHRKTRCIHEELYEVCQCRLNADFKNTS